MLIIFLLFIICIIIYITYSQYKSGNLNEGLLAEYDTENTNAFGNNNVSGDDGDITGGAETNKLYQIDEVGLKTFRRALKRLKKYKFTFCNCEYKSLKKYGKFFEGDSDDALKAAADNEIIFDENLMPLNMPMFIDIMAEEIKKIKTPKNVKTVYVDNIKPVYKALKKVYKNVSYAPDNFNMAKSGDLYWRSF